MLTTHANNTATVYNIQNIRYNIQWARCLLMWGPALLGDETIPINGHQSRYGNLVGTADSLDGR